MQSANRRKQTTDARCRAAIQQQRHHRHTHTRASPHINSHKKKRKGGKKTKCEALSFRCYRCDSDTYIIITAVRMARQKIKKPIRNI